MVRPPPIFGSSAVTRYVALIDGDAGAFGVVIPDCPGCTAMGATIEEALDNAAEALRDWTEAIEAQGGQAPEPRPPVAVRAEAIADGVDDVTYASVPLIRNLGRPVKANLSLDSGVLAAIDAAAGRLGVTRSALVEMLAKHGLPALG